MVNELELELHFSRLCLLKAAFHNKSLRLIHIEHIQVVSSVVPYQLTAISTPLTQQWEKLGVSKNHSYVNLSLNKNNKHFNPINLTSHAVVVIKHKAC